VKKSIQLSTSTLKAPSSRLFPLPFAFEMAELHFVGLDRTEERVELEAGNLIAIDADLLAPFIKESDPIGESTDFCDFAGHLTSASGPFV
jgi:hypothetical protein